MISKRLELCLNYTKGFKCLADIGCDHAYVPIEALMKGYVGKAIGIDNKIGPLEIAKTNVLKNNLEDEISLVLSDGIKDIEDADVILVAGMGGILITTILDEGKKNLDRVKRIILAPNSDIPLCRKWAFDNNFKVTSEEAFFDHEHYYEIIVLEHGKKNYSLLEIKYGPKLLEQKPEDFILMLKKRHDSYTRILEKTNNKELQDSILEINEILGNL